MDIILITLMGPIIGSLIGVMKKPSMLFMYNMLSFSAGIMIYISADELSPVSCGKQNGHWNHSMIFSLMAGVLFVMILGR